MGSLAIEDLLLATLRTASGEKTGLSTVVDQLAGNGRRMSRQVELAVAVETLVEQGLVRKNERGLSLTDEGQARAQAVSETLAGQSIDVVEDGGRRTLTVEATANEFGRSLVDIATDCSPDGIYYHEDRVTTDDLVGRGEERARFAAVLDRVSETGNGEVVRLVGPGGNGKTELGDALLEMTPDTVETAQATSRKSDTNVYQPVRDLLAQLGVEDPFETTAFEPDDAEAFDAQQTGLFTEITGLLTPDSGVRVLFFDDINQADRASWAYLAVLCEQLADRALVVVLSHRPGTLPEDAPIHPDADIEGTLIEVTGLDREATGRLIEQVVGRRGAPAAFVDAVYERTGGAPLFVETTVETLLETDQLDPGYQWYPADPDEFDLPNIVHETIQRQAAVLEPEIRDILEWVAVARGFVPVSLVAAVAGAPTARIETIIETVGSMGVLERSVRDGETQVTFRNEVFGDALADGLSESERRRRNRDIAEQLEARIGDGESSEGERMADSAATVAYHYERAGETTHALAWYERAADRATDSYAHETAVDYYYRVIHLARETDDTGRVLSANERVAEIYLITGEYDEAEKHVQYVRERVDNDLARRQGIAWLQARIHNCRSEYDAAIETANEALEWGAEQTLAHCRLLSVLANSHDGRSDYEQVRETAHRQRELAASLDEPALEADAIYQLGVVATRQDAYDDAQEYTHRCLELRREIGDRQGEARALQTLGAIARFRGESDRAYEYCHKSLEICREIGDNGFEAPVLYELGLLSANQGQYDQARAYFEECLAINREIGSREGEARSLDGIGDVAVRQGAYDRAQEYLTQSLEIIRETGNRVGEVLVLRYLGRTALRQGQYDQAREYLEGSLELAREIGHSKGEAVSLNILGDLSRRQDDDSRAREYYQQVLDIGGSEGGRRQAMTLQWLCRIACKHGEYEQAADYFDRAQELIQENNRPLEIARVQLAGGQLALARGDLETARKRCESAGETFDEIGARYWCGRYRRLRGEIEREDGNTAAAREYLENAVETFEEIGAAPDTLATLELLVEHCRGQGDDEASEEWYQHAVAVLADVAEAAADAHGEWVDRQIDDA